MQLERGKLEKEYMSDDTSIASGDTVKKQRDYAFSSKARLYRAHAYCVFNDPEFQSEVKQLRQTLEDWYYPRISLETSRYDRHILPDDRLPIKKVADKYRITLEDLAFYADGYYANGYTGFGKMLTDEGGFKLINEAEFEWRPVYVIGRYTSVEDISDDWRYVRAMADVRYSKFDESKVRKRSCDYPELVYAVFKARQKKMTFREIFDHYSKDELALFNGSSHVFKSEDSLERYYRKYKPHKQHFNEVILTEGEIIAFHNSLPKLPITPKTDT